jgi:hypothetical protein
MIFENMKIENQVTRIGLNEEQSELYFRLSLVRLVFAAKAIPFSNAVHMRNLLKLVFKASCILIRKVEKCN